MWRDLHTGPLFNQLCAGDQPSSVVQVALTLLLFSAQLAAVGSLEQLVRLSAAPVSLPSCPPGPWEDATAWHALSTDDLWGRSRSGTVSDNDRAGAEDELDRRRHAGHRLPDPDLRIPAMLLPRVDRPQPG